MTLGKINPPIEEAVALEAATVDVYPISDRVARYRKLKEMERDIAERLKETRDEIVGYIGERGAEFGSIDGQLLVRVRTVTTRRIDTTALKAKEPELAERFTKATESKRLELIEL